MEYIVYFEKKKENILDFFPANISESFKEIIFTSWNQPVCRAILKYLSKVEETTAPEIKDAIGHSMSTLHENIMKLERDGLIETEMSYVQNKKKIIRSKVLFVTKNSRVTEAITRFLNQGLLVDTKTSNKLIKFLDANSDKPFTCEQISAKTGIQVDEVQTLLDNWDTLITRAFSDALKPQPFIKRVTYQSSKSEKIDLKIK